ncbi:hypothetical protein Z043_101437, partial [Scleropages formosus]
TEIAKRLNTICAQVIPFLSQELACEMVSHNALCSHRMLSTPNPCLFVFGQHQQQVAQAVERAKQVTMAELNAIIGQQHLSHGHGPPVPLTPHPAGLHPAGLPHLGGSASLLALSSALGAPPHLPVKEDKKNNHESDHHRGERPGKID